MVDKRKMQQAGYLQTGQRSCHDVTGRAIPCAGSGQDAEFHNGRPWPQTRFEPAAETVRDALTGLVWTRNASLAQFPLNWDEALAFCAELNRTQAFGYSDWRLPNRRELRSLISHQTRKPALPEDHPFEQVFTHWYWSSTTVAAHPSHAWYVNLEGGRMFYGGKDQAFMLWPVRGPGNGALAQTGQRRCYDARGQAIACKGSAQDGALRCGQAWPQPRWERTEAGLVDRLTNLLWHPEPGLGGALSWQQALNAVDELKHTEAGPRWRLPNINELESLVDCAEHHPALPRSLPLSEPGSIFWSSTSSLYEPDWAWALYSEHGAVGVGQKGFARFGVWAVANAPNEA